MNKLKKTIRILYFARLREERGQSEEIIQTRANTASQLYKELQKTHDLSLDPAHLRVAINDEFHTWESILNQNDVVTFIPPVAGG
jgi:molybdopterin synthase sulfur carrier subunit